MFKQTSSQIDFPQLEKDILNYWNTANIYGLYLMKNHNSKQNFSFIDGPITANNPMGVHHAWGRTYKDLWQRFYTMCGFRQRYQNGFDCQGLWVEVEVEKELGIKNKKEIENLVVNNKKESIAKFVNLCKSRVLKYSKIQTQQTKRLGNFMDWENSYYTMSDENNYMIWHFLKTCFDKGWIYKGLDSVPWCPRCETAISQHEMLTEDYKELTHETVFVKYRVTDRKNINIDVKDLYLLIWTTTPWTVPANVAIGVNIKYIYSVWKCDAKNEAIIILEKDDLGHQPSRLYKGRELSLTKYLFNDKEDKYEKILEIKGKDLLDLSYQGPFDNVTRIKKAKADNPHKFHHVIDASDIVVADEGTGLLHIAPGAGKEDFDLGKKENLTVISLISDDASYLEEMDEFTHKNAKKHPEVIIEFLKTHQNGEFLFKSLLFTHRYPACWRCKTELVWKVTQEWYIAMDKPEKSLRENGKIEKTLREQMIDTAKKIKWHPDFGLERELDWLTNMHDWLISKKNRYWGLALPIFECSACLWFTVIGSKEELKQKAVSGWSDFVKHSPHKPYIDSVKIVCGKCQNIISRVDDVGNVWLDAGIVPFSTLVDPNSNKLSYTTDKKYWQEWFPADFITESFPGQFKNWFYSMIAMSTVLEKTNPFKTVLGYASVLGEDGRPMHKSWGNAIEFNEAADRIGVDVMRWMYASQNPTDNLLFGYKKADETRRRFHLKLWNIYNFFINYAIIDCWSPQKENTKVSENILDQWILSELDNLIKVVTHNLLHYKVNEAASTIDVFIDDLSVWYVRRSRDRIGPTIVSGVNKENTYATLYQILLIISKILAPFIPFLSEEIYRNLTNQKSVHLTDWPKSLEIKYPQDLSTKMKLVRKICELGHAARKNHNIKVRLPLPKIEILNSPLTLEEEFIQLIKDELNIKNVLFKTVKGDFSIILDTKQTVLLKTEGEARDLIRKIQIERKKMKCSLSEKIVVILPNWPERFAQLIKEQTLATKLIKGKDFSIKKEHEV